MKKNFLVFCALIALVSACSKRSVIEPGSPDTPPAPSLPPGLNNSSNTTSTGQQLFVIVGNSIARGRSEANGPTPKARTVYEWNGAKLVTIGSRDLLEASQGSAWPQFGIDYNKNFSTKVVFCNTAVSGSYFSPTTGDEGNNWSTTGLRYTEMITSVKEALANLSVQKPRGIFVELGINDARSKTDLSTIKLDVTSLFNRLETDFPDVRIYITNVGRHETAISAPRIDSIRNFIETEVSAREDILMAYDLRIFANDFPQYYSDDGVHLTQPGNNAWGSIMATFLKEN